MKIKVLKLKSQGRKTFKNQKSDVILTLTENGNLTASKTPQVGDIVSTDIGGTPADGILYLPEKNLSIKIANGKVVEVIDLTKAVRKAHRKP